MPKLKMVRFEEEEWNSFIGIVEHEPSLVPRELHALADGDETSDIESGRVEVVMDWWRRNFPRGPEDLVVVPD